MDTSSSLNDHFLVALSSQRPDPPSRFAASHWLVACGMVARVTTITNTLMGHSGKKHKRKEDNAIMTYPRTLRTAAEGRTVAVVGDVYRFLATGEDTNGKYALWEAIVPPGGGPPPHVHSREEEGFYILEGEITFQIGEERIVAGAGMFANMPVGTPHVFKNESGNPARMLISVAPAGLEQMFFEVGVPVAQGATTAERPTQAEIDRLLAAAPRYGIEIRLPAP
jgi:quercetin dioxygenase-like cupin family protein